MTRYYALHEANDAIPDVERVLIALREQRADLVGLRDRVVELEGPEEGPGSGDDGAELRRLRLRMQGLIDQMQAGVARLVALDVQLRDIPTGLIDFPALAAGRPIWLCWRLGEGPIEFWHGHDEGFSARRELSELPTGGGQA
jgi:hypothetical protein